MKFESIDSLRIGALGGVESIQRVKAVHVVVATPIFGHWSLLQRNLLRRADGGLRCGLPTATPKTQ
jgi:hypothetical protein